MIVLDANYILRFLLQDNKSMFVIAKQDIVNNNCYVGSAEC
jgi:predicted nucleic-acid-binding protein